jgi:hypothetical protein
MREKALRKQIIQTLGSGSSFSIYNPEKTPNIKFDNFALGVLREMEDEGFIVSDSKGFYKLNK